LDWLVPIRPSNPEKEGVTIKFPFPPAGAVTQYQTRAATQTPDPKIMIYCLGPLRVLNNRQFITNWPSHKAQLVFKYLLLHHTILVHLNPSIPIWIDYPVFEQHYVTAQQKERAGFVDQAMVEYALAEEMYMDHLFSEDLYEDWVRSQREYLWQIYLSAAIWLAEYHFQKKNYSLAISFGQRILQKDPCEETAHQILMRCFHNQGQRQLAIRQYEICRQALREGLDVEPSGTTKQFFSEILSD
jgi:DNA-binding SARP family transcriptional activator